MYDASKDEAKDECQTVEQLEKNLSKNANDEVIKCGACYGDFNIFTRPNDINECFGDVGGLVVVPCGTDKDGELKYPTCIWDGSKRRPDSKCETRTKLIQDLDKKKDDGDILLDCGFCDELNLFEEYWEPPVPPPEIDGCDWDTIDTCEDGSGKKADNENHYPVCIWDAKKWERKNECLQRSKLDSLKKDEYLIGCSYCDDILL